MSVITDPELEQLRKDIENLLPDTATILTPSSTVDSGFVSQVWGTAGIVSCRLDYINRGAEIQTAAALKSYPGYIFTFPHDAPVAENSRVVVNGEAYNIVSVDSDKSWSVCLRALAMKLENE